MSVTLISHDRVVQTPSAVVRDGDLLLSLDDLTLSTGWEKKPQGMCLADRCVPIASTRAGEWLAPDDRFNLSAFARYIEAPLVYDDAAAVALLGESASSRSEALQSLEAPDFRLPDLDGVTHALSDYRGKKVLLLSWASW